MPVIAVASCSAAPPKAPRRRSSKSSLSIADETTSSSVQPAKTKSLESSKRKRKSSEQVSDAELQAASSLEVVSAIAAEPPATAVDTIVSQLVRPQDEASPEFTNELELTIHRGENPVQDAPLVEIREDLPEGHVPSPSLAAFNKSFGTFYRGELLSVGCEAAGTRGGTSKILTL
jgi:hypothetical protein